MVVNGREERRYTRVQEESIVFGPDSKQLAYVAQDFRRRLGFMGEVGRRSMVVFAGLKGTPYDRIVNAPEGASVVFDSPDQG